MTEYVRNIQPISKVIKKMIEQAIAEAGSISELADVVKAQRATVSKWANGAQPSYHYLDKIQRFLAHRKVKEATYGDSK